MKCLTLYMLLIIYVHEYFMQFMIVSASKGNPDPSRLKKMRDTIRKETSIRFNKERIINNDKNILKTNALLDKDNKNINKLSSDDNLIELYVRRIDDNISSGPWSYFQDLSMNSLDEDINRNNIIDSLTNGGIESELIRPNLDHLVSLKVYGKGLGEPLVLDKLKQTLPQFKKLKGRQFQFGYKIAETDIFISTLDRNMNNKGLQPSSSLSKTSSSGVILQEPIQMINITSILENTNNPTSSVDIAAIHNILQQTHNNIIDNKALSGIQQSPLELLIHRIDVLLQQTLLQNASSSSSSSTTILISADGSAAFSGSTCIDAAAGVFAMPIAARNQITIPNLKTNSSSDEYIVTANMNENMHQMIIDSDSTTISSTGIVSNEDIKTPSSGRSFSNIHHPSSSSSSSASELFSGDISNAIYLSVFDFKGMITTPFDAELAAGLAGVTLAHLILKRSKLLLQSSSSSSNHHPIINIKFQILSDSRSFLRTLRKDFNDDVLLRSSSSNMMNRFALWTCIMKHYEEMSSTTSTSTSNSTTTATASSSSSNSTTTTTASSNSATTTTSSSSSSSSKDKDDSTSIFKTEWFPGHPERRDLHVETWSVRDKAIWVADELARYRSSSSISSRISQVVNDDIAQKLYVKDGLQINREKVIDLKALELLSISKVLLNK